MGVIDVEAGPVGQHGVEHAGVEVGRAAAEAASVPPRCLLVVRPADPARSGIGRHHQARRRDRVVPRPPAHADAELGLGPEDLGDAEAHRYWPVLMASMERCGVSPPTRVRT